MFDEKLINQFGLVKYQKLFDGVQYLYKLDNLLGASVVRHSFSYGGKKGLYELAPISIYEEDFDINDEPTGNLTVEQVIEMLEDLRHENKN